MNNLRIDAKIMELDGFKAYIDQVTASIQELEKQFKSSITEITQIVTKE